MVSDGVNKQDEKKKGRKEKKGNQKIQAKTMRRAEEVEAILKGLCEWNWSYRNCHFGRIDKIAKRNLWVLARSLKFLNFQKTFALFPFLCLFLADLLVSADNFSPTKIITLAAVKPLVNDDNIIKVRGWKENKMKIRAFWTLTIDYILQNAENAVSCSENATKNPL